MGVYCVLGGSLDSGDQSGNDGRVSKCRGIAQFMVLVVNDLSENASHDLARASLGVVANEVDTLGSSERTNDLANLQSQFLLQTFSFFGIGLEGDKGMDTLTSQVIVTTNDSSFGDRVVKDQSRLDFRRGKSVTRDVDDIYKIMKELV